MSALAPVDAASCRAMAVECGRRANKHWARGFTGKAKREVERARELTLLALKFEQEEQVSARGITSNAEQAGSTTILPVEPVANSSMERHEDGNAVKADSPSKPVDGLSPEPPSRTVAQFRHSLPAQPIQPQAADKPEAGPDASGAHSSSPSQAAVVTDENLREPMAAASDQIVREVGDAPHEASDGGSLPDTEFRADGGADITIKHESIRT